MNDACLILNPASRGGKSQRLFARIHAALEKEGITCRHHITTSLEDAETFSRAANLAGERLIVAVGGDGTLNRVINGFYGPDGTRLSPARLGVIYTGTSPDFCLSHGLPVRDPERAARILKQGYARPIGIGRIAYADGFLRHFACCANIGLGAQLARAANSGIRAQLGDRLGTFLALLRVLKQYRPVELTLNGQRYQHLYNLSIGKTRHVASGLKIRHTLAPDDARFYLLAVKDRVVHHLVALYSGAALPLEYVERVDISGKAEVEFDGDACGQLPITITAATPLEVMLPEPEAPGHS